MEIFPERLLQDIERVPGGGHSYLRQVCAADGADLRARLERLANRLGPPVDGRAADLLGSFDNRRFFQGFSELVTVGLLGQSRWRARGLLPPGPRVEIRGPTGEPFLLSVLAFLHQTRPGGESETRARLVTALGQVRGRDRFVVLIRRWLPHDFDPTPIRRAVEMWLAKVSRNAWEGRYAAYEDEHVCLEFALTGAKTRGRQSALADVIGPFVGHRALEVVEPRLVQEIDRHNASSARSRSLVVAVVADQPWTLTPGYLRDLLYGRATSHAVVPGESEVIEFGPQSSVSVFRDPLYANVSAVLLVDRDPAVPALVRAQVLTNPWARERLGSAAFPVCCFSDDDGAGRAGPGRAGETAQMSWHHRSARTWEIG